MRSLLSFTFVFLAAVCGVTATASPKQHSVSSLCAPGIEFCALDYQNRERKQNGAPSRTVPFALKKLRLSNAERLARHMPLNSPKPHQTVDRRQEPSPSPTSAGVAAITGPNSSSVGYMGAATVGGAIYGTSNQLIDSAVMYVEHTGSGSGVQTGVRITVPGSDVGQNFPILGLVQGRDNTDTDAGPGSYHYFYVSGVATPGTSTGATSSIIANTYSHTTSVTRAVQTNVWTVDFSTGEISAVWVNSDGTPVSLHLFLQSGAIYATADIAAFQTEYEGVTPITLHLIT